MEYKECSLREAQLRMFEILKEVDRICKKYNIQYWLEAGTLLGAIRHNGFIPWDDDLDIGMFRADYNKFLKVVFEELDKRYICQTPLTDRYAQAPWLKIRDVNSYIIGRLKSKQYSGLFIDILPFDDKTSKNISDKKLNNKIINLKWKTELDYKKPFMNNIARNGGLILLKTTFKIFPYRMVLKSAYKKGLNAEVINGQEIDYGVESPWNINLKREYITPVKYYKFESGKFPVPNNYEKVLEILYNDWRKLPPINERKATHSNKIFIK